MDKKTGQWYTTFVVTFGDISFAEIRATPCPVALIFMTVLTNTEMYAMI